MQCGGGVWEETLSTRCDTEIYMVMGRQAGLPAGPPPQLWPKLLQHLCEHLLCPSLGGYFLGTCSQRKCVLRRTGNRCLCANIC